MTLEDVYQHYIVDLNPILWEMGRVNGIHVDNVERLKLVAEMDAIIAKEMAEAQEGIPEKLFPLEHLKTRDVAYSRLEEGARDVREIQVGTEVKTCTYCGQQGVTKTDHTGRKGGRNGVPLNGCYHAPVELRPGFVTEYDVVLPFNPGSDDQLRDYANLYHHKLGRNWKTEEDTLDIKQLEKIIARHGDKHPVYAHARTIRRVRKARGYAKSWEPDELGLIYGQFKNNTETFRLSQSDHNLMNVSHRGDAPYAEELRRLLVAPPGYLLVEGDSSSVEAVFSGLFMGSPEYMELARKGIHAWWALKKLGLDATPENIKRVKHPESYADFWAGFGKTPVQVQILYETKKRTVHGVSYGMGAKLLHESYPEFFPRIQWLNPKTNRLEWSDIASAQAEIDEFYALVPDLLQWHKDTRSFAHKNGYLVSPWGVKNYYYRVFSYDWENKQWKLGEDAKACIAFQPQHANAMFQRENLKLLYDGITRRGKKGKWFLTAIGQVHDSNGMRVPEDDVDAAKELFVEVMNRPLKMFGGLQIGMDVKRGRNWAAMESY